jgi:hypothetical protein
VRQHSFIPSLIGGLIANLAFDPRARRADDARNRQAEIQAVRRFGMEKCMTEHQSRRFGMNVQH